MIGQMRQPGSTEDRQWTEAHGKIKALNLDMGALRQAYAKLLVIKNEQIRACANILQALASYVQLDNYIRIMNEPLSSRVKQHISSNLRDTLSIPELARQFGVGKTTLCGAVKRDYQLTVNELVRHSRIERAKELLRLDKQPISVVAEQVGIPDYNYFAKVFKEETGAPPSLFRKLCEGEYRYKTEQLQG
jgi:AraC-like DNA-binding protein